jgi:hypothetical protein
MPQLTSVVKEHDESNILGSTVAKVPSHWTLTTEALVWSQTSPCGTAALRCKTSEVYVYKTCLILKTVPQLKCSDAGLSPQSYGFSSGCNCGMHSGTATKYFCRNYLTLPLLTLIPLLLSALLSPCVIWRSSTLSYPLNFVWFVLTRHVVGQFNGFNCYFCQSYVENCALWCFISISIASRRCEQQACWNISKRGR